MSETRARARRLARSAGSRVRKGLIGRRAPASASTGATAGETAGFGRDHADSIAVAPVLFSVGLAGAAAPGGGAYAGSTAAGSDGAACAVASTDDRSGSLATAVGVRGDSGA